VVPEAGANAASTQICTQALSAISDFSKALQLTRKPLLVGGDVLLESHAVHQDAPVFNAVAGLLGLTFEPVDL
jgi:hypothetical protein